MKLLKKLFTGISILVMLLCAGVLILALSPDLTKSLSKRLYGDKETKGILSGLVTEESTSQDGENSGGIFYTADPEDIAQGVLAEDDRIGYLVPGRTLLVLPEQVSGKNGYQPVEETKEQTLQEETADAGSTGEDYAFDTEIYPYYGMLNAKMQKVYQQIYANALRKNPTFSPVESIQTDQFKNVYEAVYNDHPELFWLDTAYSCKYLSDGQCVEVTLSFYDDQDTQKLEQIVQEILAGAPGEGTEEQEKYIHDVLVERVTYDKDADMGQSAYSALVNGRSVCAGYARAFQYLLQQLKIPCYYCTGYSGASHAWNLVKLGEQYRNVDVTWDDTEPATTDYYNRTDAEYVGTHIRTGLSIYLPACDLGEASEIVLNPDPIKPLEWKKNSDSDTVFVSGGDTYDMDKAKVTEDMVQTSLKAYYENCLLQMTDRGAGQQSFSNVVPKYVLNQLEREYGTGDYWDAYVTDGLKKLGKENFAIQIQIEDLGGNYYRVYHNINTW